jgi:hypothetical protein
LLYKGIDFDDLFSFFGRPLKHLSQKEDLKLLMELILRRKIINCIFEILKAFLHPSPPFGKRKFIRIVGFMIPNVTNLSIPKMRL